MNKFLLYVLFITCGSCAPLGTSFKSYTKVESSKINKIGIVITKAEYRNVDFQKAVEKMFIQNLISSLNNVLGKEAIYLGYANDILEKGENFIKEQSIEVIIRCEMVIYGIHTLDNSNRYNTKVRTQLFKVPEKNLVADTKFNTRLGKSYALHPLLETAIKDGVNGAIKPLKKIQINKM